MFIKDSFDTIKSYFQKGLRQLEAKYQEVETDFTEIHRFKFIGTIYLHGEVRNRCKIWVGGPVSSDSIAYYEGTHDFDADNTFNDWLSIEQEGLELGLKASDMGLGSLRHLERDRVLSAEEAAEYLWRRFTER